MDPNAILHEVHSLVDEALEDGLTTSDAAHLAEVFATLDEWIPKGGFLPEAWRK